LGRTTAPAPLTARPPSAPRLASPRCSSRRAGNFLEYKDQKLVYKRYASLFFVMGIGKEDNELM
jgi:hypothetical protein